MPIQVLPPQLANQIAAGEVVERPASVVKELVENSLDAGATRIDIDIEKGGAKLIRIRDNGSGIAKEDLALALARHATSKISSLDDLEAISSLGFRGEALASISAVSRLTLTSRTQAQSEAWQAYAEGRDMAVTVKPAAHPVGTTLEVLDLFYNTPARRKFMRTEKTEFTHIDEIIRRIALARFDVAFSLSHNGKLIRQYRAVNEVSQRERRLGAICGTAFLEHALRIEWQHGDLHLHGWVADPAGARTANELQYCYVNGRMMRDRLINHAIRQAYQEKLSGEHQPAWVFYLELDPHQVDVNVHPAKHEVRFHQSRLVHDFIYQGVMSVLQESAQTTLPAVTPAPRQPDNRAAAGGNHFSLPSASSGGGRQPVSGKRNFQHQAPHYSTRENVLYQKLMKVEEEPKLVSTNLTECVSPPLTAHSQSFGRVLSVVKSRFALVEQEPRLALISLPAAVQCLRQAQLEPGESGLKPQPLLIPLRMKVDKEYRETLNRCHTLLHKMGIEAQSDGQHVTLRAVPLPLRQQNLQILIPELLGYLTRQPEDVTATQVAQWLAQRSVNEHPHWNHSQAIALLADVERLCPRLLTSPPSDLMQFVDLESALTALKYD